MSLASKVQILNEAVSVSLWIHYIRKYMNPSFLSVAEQIEETSLRERKTLFDIEGRVFTNGPGDLGSIPGRVIL